MAKRWFVRIETTLLTYPSTGATNIATVAGKSPRYLEALGAASYVAMWSAMYGTRGVFHDSVWHTFVRHDSRSTLLKIAVNDGLIEKLGPKEYRLLHHTCVDQDVRLPIRDDVRRAVYERDHFRCVECGTTEDLSVDHIIAWSLGGLDDPSNFQTLCRPCNASKGDRSTEGAAGG